MRSFTALIVLAITLYMRAVPSKADVIAWSGDSCNGAEGGDVPCDGTCFDFTNRHSLEVARGGHCLRVFEDTSCTEKVAEYGNQGGGECVNINTGTPVRSFRCNIGSSC
ncbi:hypothetical protein B0H17DRAFT_920093 [Mycena rosella]|uniref:Uncharacterized protein n=1 Tax=Mycena rosella TaxID=1033263 RepID=A0AAD7GTY8_MYCRO|nr:hypothetical protein B0H17DRAFT_920093 [Mycena rosella]